MIMIMIRGGIIPSYWTATSFLEEILPSRKMLKGRAFKFEPFPYCEWEGWTCPRPLISQARTFGRSQILLRLEQSKVLATALIKLILFYIQSLNISSESLSLHQQLTVEIELPRGRYVIDKLLIPIPKEFHSQFLTYLKRRYPSYRVVSTIDQSAIEFTQSKIFSSK